MHNEIIYLTPTPLRRRGEYISIISLVLFFEKEVLQPTRSKALFFTEVE